MNKTILQVPIDTNLRKAAEIEAQRQGFSSLQEVVRIFLNKMAEKKISVTFEETVTLSAKAARRYDKLIKDIESGKEKVYKAESVEDLMKQLHAKT